MKATVLQFDPLARANRKRLAAEIAEFIELLLTAEQKLKLRERARRQADHQNFTLAIEALVCNLLLSSQASNAILAVPRSHKVMWGKSRYRNAVYGKHFVGLLDLLSELRFVSELTRGYRFNNTAKQSTTIKPTKKFLRRFSIPEVRANWLKQAEEPEVLLQKSSKDAEGVSSLIDYEETAATKRLRNEVRQINVFLSTAKIFLLTEDGEARLDRDRNVTSAHQRSLRRIFNNGSWNEGGRLFGGFWMNMERSQRFSSIRIDGKRIANVDFSALFPRLAYTLISARPPRDDLYQYKGILADRDGWKKLTNALLFAAKPIKSWPTETKLYFSNDVKLSTAIEAIKEKHAPIAAYFEQGVGYRLMRIESDLLIKIVTRLSAENIVALPLHDSVLVAKPFAARAKNLMEVEFKRHTGSTALVTIDTGRRKA
jgi:hypothetical protein